jgi:ABC-type spermidine/putrescine transport system permease subunit II
LPRTFGGGAGGSGIVILKYPNMFTISIGAGLTGTTTSSGDFKITTFTAGTGTVTFS